jgi:hypothetical protein
MVLSVNERAGPWLDRRLLERDDSNAVESKPARRTGYHRSIHPTLLYTDHHQHALLPSYRLSELNGQIDTEPHVKKLSGNELWHLFNGYLVCRVAAGRL